MAKRNKNEHLLLRGRIWWFNRRLSGSNRYVRRSLGTSELESARAQRDAILARWDEERTRIADARNVVALRKLYLDTLDSDERSLIEEQIIDHSEALAEEMSRWEMVKAASAVDPVDTRAQSAIDFWRTATGRLTPFSELTPHWLETIENKRTRSDYRRGMDVLSTSFAAVEEISWDKARTFLRAAQQAQGVSSATVRKWVSGYINFWSCFDKDAAVWRNHRFPRDNASGKRPWGPDEVRKLYEVLRQEDDWLQHPVWIAAHTGARIGAICGLSYDRDAQTIRLPRQKREASERVIPAHPAIHESLAAWTDAPRRSSTVISRFSSFKQQLGYGPETDLHSFRRTLITELENLGCPEAVTADIVGHKKQTITYGLYSGGSRLELMRHWLAQVHY